MSDLLLRPNVACAKCGKLFYCGSDADDCWCEGMTLDERQRKALSASGLEGCLCADCLEGI